MGEWRLLLTGKADGAWNMAVDEAILQAHALGKVPNTIRFFGWQPACVSIGFFQSLEREIDLDQCRALGVDYVRRPTGGRVVLHDAELTYSIVAGESDPFVSGSIKESYRKISQAVVIALRSLGANVQAERLKSGEALKKRTGVCFDSRSDYELSFEGRKLVGSAQCRRDGVVLQHGSILLDVDANSLFTLTGHPNNSSREDLVRQFSDKVATLKEAIGRPVSFEEAVRAAIGGFEKVLGADLESGLLTSEERGIAEDLREKKYTKREWNLRK